MELLNTIIGVPYIFHCLTVSIVFLGAILLFVFGFKSTEEPTFNKIKTDSKSVGKKKKNKEKKSGSLVSSAESKLKGNTNGKVKIRTTDEKGKKSNTLKDSKNMNNISIKSQKKERIKDEKIKKKGKENINAKLDFIDEGDGWEQAKSRKDKKNRKNQNSPKEGSAETEKKHLGKNIDLINSKSLKTDTKKSGKENKKNAETPKKDKKIKLDESAKEKKTNTDNSGVWQEAKSSKKRKKVLKDA